MVWAGGGGRVFARAAVGGGGGSGRLFLFGGLSFWFCLYEVLVWSFGFEGWSRWVKIELGT